MVAMVPMTVSADGDLLWQRGTTPIIRVGCAVLVGKWQGIWSMYMNECEKGNVGGHVSRMCHAAQGLEHLNTLNVHFQPAPALISFSLWVVATTSQC